MSKLIKIMCAVLSLSLLCSCTQEGKSEPKTYETETITETTTDYEDIETTVSPEPMGTADKKSHSYGVAKNGVAHDISMHRNILKAIILKPFALIQSRRKRFCI